MFQTYNNCYYGTCGDGNCFYRACSKLLCGKEDLCYFLRGLTSIELYSNQEFYAFHPYVRANAHIFWCENIAFSVSVLDSALGDEYDRKDPSSRKLVVQRETIRNAKSGIAKFKHCLVLNIALKTQEIAFPRGEGGSKYKVSKIFAPDSITSKNNETSCFEYRFHLEKSRSVQFDFYDLSPPSPIHNVEDILFTKKCGLVSLQQHCFRGKGGGGKYKVSKIFHLIVATISLLQLWLVVVLR